MLLYSTSIIDDVIISHIIYMLNYRALGWVRMDGPPVYVYIVQCDY